MTFPARWGKIGAPRPAAEEESMKFGVWIPNCRHLAIPDIMRATAAQAEELDYDSVWVSDHVVVPTANIAGIGEAIYDPLVTLAVVAGSTRRVRLGTTVLIVPYRNPVVTAKMVASLDALSGGRVILGVGAGWLAAESAALGVPFAQRGPMTDEYLRAMQELWRDPDPSFAGTYTQFSGLKFAPRPVQRPHPPLWVGGHSRAALRRAVEFGAAWHPINRSPDELRAGRDQLDRLARSAGRPQPPAIALRNDIRILRRGETAPASSHAGRVLAGESAALVEQIRELADCGVEHLVLEFLAEDGPALRQQLATFAAEVRPAFSGTAG
jgi:probable F420-dependent oxidoreductase